ncbi:hypothetical protein [Paenibacillus silvae]|uniref:hypothetical protein n=1 Tax=Paenibacillus silvae TaxID=1325358 RepID=UPI0011A3AB76|nr:MULTISPECIES: hypothetical protein [Paenibacillus]MCK6076905.1 hypothetical protein [Paenibacillus silvae]MCK6152347.1 hypothetical protein [Paenibacillus silvae]MCK6269588.1 hypothetical protein [Paenibacillus silvae]
MKKVVGALLAGLGIGAVGAFGVAGAAAIIIITLLLKPLFALLIGWVIGFGLRLIAGSFVASTLSTIFNTAITASALPQLFAGIVLLTSFIKTFPQCCSGERK